MHADARRRRRRVATIKHAHPAVGAAHADERAARRVGAQRADTTDPTDTIDGELTLHIPHAQQLTPRACRQQQTRLLRPRHQQRPAAVDLFAVAAAARLAAAVAVAAHFKAGVLLALLGLRIPRGEEVLAPLALKGAPNLDGPARVAQQKQLLWASPGAAPATAGDFGFDPMRISTEEGPARQKQLHAMELYNGES